MGCKVFSNRHDSLATILLALTTSTGSRGHPRTELVLLVMSTATKYLIRSRTSKIRWSGLELKLRTTCRNHFRSRVGVHSTVNTYEQVRTNISVASWTSIYIDSVLWFVFKKRVTFTILLHSTAVYNIIPDLCARWSALHSLLYGWPLRD